jgi:hypothetical protein
MVTADDFATHVACQTLRQTLYHRVCIFTRLAPHNHGATKSGDAMPVKAESPHLAVYQTKPGGPTVRQICSGSETM